MNREGIATGIPVLRALGYFMFLLPDYPVISLTLPEQEKGI